MPLTPLHLKVEADLGQVKIFYVKGISRRIKKAPPRAWPGLAMAHTVWGVGLLFLGLGRLEKRLQPMQARIEESKCQALCKLNNLHRHGRFDFGMPPD